MARLDITWRTGENQNRFGAPHHSVAIPRVPSGNPHGLSGSSAAHRSRRLMFRTTAFEMGRAIYLQLLDDVLITFCCSSTRIPSAHHRIQSGNCAVVLEHCSQGQGQVRNRFRIMYGDFIPIEVILQLMSTG